MGLIAGWRLRRAERKRIITEELKDDIRKVCKRLKGLIEERDKLEPFDAGVRRYEVFIDRDLGLLRELIRKARISGSEFRRLLLEERIRGNAFKEITKKAA